MVTKKRYLNISVNENGEIIGRGAKGVITARKDSCRLARNIYAEIATMALEDKPKKEMYDVINQYFLKFFTRQIPIKDFIIYKGVKDVNNYKSTTALHVILGKRMQERGTEVPINTKMDYVMLWDSSKRNNLQGERAEDYTYFRDNRIKYGFKLDYVYYIENQLSKPLNQLLDTRYPGVKTNYIIPELYIFGIISTLPITIQRKVKEITYRDKDTILLLKEECETRAENVKDNRKYLIAVDLCNRYLEAYNNKDENNKTKIIYKILGRIHCLSSNNKKIIDRQGELFHKLKYIVKNITEPPDLLKYCRELFSRMIIVKRCKQFNIAPPKSRKPHYRTSIMVIDENFIKDVATTHCRYRDVIEEINFIVGPFQVVN